MERLTIHLPKAIIDKMKTLKKEDYPSYSEIIRQALRDFLQYRKETNKP